MATHILPNISQKKQPDNETWSIDKIYQDKYVSSKIMQKKGRETSSRPLFAF